MFTITIFGVYFLIVFVNWLIYFVLLFSLNSEDEIKKIDSVFYIGEYISWFFIILVQTYYTFEMFMVRICLETPESIAYF